MSWSRVRNASCLSQANSSEEIQSAQFAQTPFFLFRIINYFRLMHELRAGGILSWTSALNECCVSHRSQQIRLSQDVPLMSYISYKLTSNNWYFHPMENTEIWNSGAESRLEQGKAEAQTLSFALPPLLRF